ncbi:MAG: GC-type dockerin domain-anchored protein [Planctomycetota bacterium]
MGFGAIGVSCVLSAAVVCGHVRADVEPPYVNSVVSNDLAFIFESDPNAIESFRYVTRARREMPDKRSNRLFADAYIFEAIYTTTDGGTQRVEIWANTDFQLLANAAPYASRLARAIGLQPELFRGSLRHVVLHTGDETAFAEERGGFFVIYADNMDDRVATDDLQHTVFHECAHVALEAAHAESAGWLAAQRADPGFITEYARDNAVKEDVPESAIFAFAVLNYPGRLSAEVEATVRSQMPNRLAYFAEIDGFLIGAGGPACRADVNGDGVLTLGDFDAWVAAYVSGGAGCDQNGDGSCTPADLHAWMVGFNAGC